MRSLLLFAVLFHVQLHGQATRVLFIGNSYTYSNDLPGMFTQLSASLGEPVETAMVAPGGYTFQGHTTYAATQSAIAEGNWDVVVLQEQSQRPAFSPAQVEQEVYPYATLLTQQIHAVDPCTEVVFLMTWGREDGDAQNCIAYPPVCTYDGMQQRLRDSYVEMAVDNSAWCAPVGAVWRAFRMAEPGIGLYTDGSHPNAAGSYIAATTLFSTVFRRSSTPSTFAPAAVPVELAADIRTLASSVVADSASVWNIGINDPIATADVNMLDGLTVLFANNTMGAVQQEWTFGDGNSSADADPMHTYGAPGIYTASLAVVDACGRTDTLWFTVDLSTATGVDTESGAKPIPEVRVTIDHIEVTGISTPSTFQLMDAVGRTLSQQVLPTDRTSKIDLPHRSVGSYLWIIKGSNGAVHSGKFL